MAERLLRVEISSSAARSVVWDALASLLLRRRRHVTLDLLRAQRSEETRLEPRTSLSRLHANSGLLQDADGECLPPIGRIARTGSTQVQSETPECFGEVDRPYRWVSTATLAATTRQLIGQLPSSIAGIVGIPRSGMIPASILATMLQVPLLELDNSGEIRCLGHGGRGAAFGWSSTATGQLVVVDDTVYSGRTIARAREQTRSIREHLVFAAVFVRPEVSSAVDLAGAYLQSPHLLEWNFFNSAVIVGNAADPALWGGAALDFDGILCEDPTVPDADDGLGLDAYMQWMEAARPKWLPRSLVIPCIITARLEKWRSITVKWLQKHGVVCQSLIMHPANCASERNACDIAGWKSEQLKRSGCTWYVESDPNQARRINLQTGLRVICPDIETIFSSQMPVQTQFEEYDGQFRNPASVCLAGAAT